MEGGEGRNLLKSSTFNFFKWQKTEKLHLELCNFLILLTGTTEKPIFQQHKNASLHFVDVKTVLLQFAWICKCLSPHQPSVPGQGTLSRIFFSNYFPSIMSVLNTEGLKWSEITPALFGEQMHSCRLHRVFHNQRCTAKIWHFKICGNVWNSCFIKNTLQCYKKQNQTLKVLENKFEFMT